MRLSFRPLPDFELYGPLAVQAEHYFSNGYGVSVVRHKFSYGSEDGLYELAVLKDGEITYETHITSDVLGSLTLEEAERIADEVAAIGMGESVDRVAPKLDRSGRVPRTITEK